MANDSFHHFSVTLMGHYYNLLEVDATIVWIQTKVIN